MTSTHHLQILGVALTVLLSAQGLSNSPIQVKPSPLNLHESSFEPEAAPVGKSYAVLAGGCFWCTEAIYVEMEGVERVESGYTGGHIKNPGYREVCSGRTGHAEGVRITFDPAVVSYESLLEVFWKTHDPTTLKRQGPDVGTQ